jgi:signal peptidase I
MEQCLNLDTDTDTPVPMGLIDPFQNYCLNLIPGRYLSIRANDQESTRVVEALTAAMSLIPVSPDSEISPEAEWRELRVIVEQDWRGPVVDYNESGIVFCRLPAPGTHDTYVGCMALLGLAIARMELSRGGALIHGALSEVPAHLGGGGVLLAGPGMAGKTTASSRLAPPWRSRTDDSSLVVGGGSGRYQAHPWPTWSRFLTAPDGKPGPGGSWDVQCGLDLRAIFFLSKAEHDRVEPLNTAAAATFLLETIQHVSRSMTLGLPSDQIREIHRQEYLNAEALVRAVPAYTLHLSLTGAFWEKIEEVIVNNPPGLSQPQEHLSFSEDFSGSSKSSSRAVRDDDSLMIVSYTGPSMNPTLCHPDLLEVEPYTKRVLQRGDVVYFTPPAGSPKTVHRIVRITADGIITRGDNNTADDPFRVKPEDIIGRVVAAQRFGQCRTIAGGPLGRWVGFRAGFRRRSNRFFSPCLHEAYRKLVAFGLLRALLPVSLRPQVFEFKRRYSSSILKLIVKGRIVGCYDAKAKQWLIDRPWRLVVDETKLPVVNPGNRESSVPDPHGL